MCEKTANDDGGWREDRYDGKKNADQRTRKSYSREERERGGAPRFKILR